MTEDILAGMIAGGMFATIFMILLAWYILMVIASWRIFKKFGEPGWKSIVPFYNSYIIFKHTWDVKYFFVLLVLGVIVGASSGADGVLKVISSVAGLACAVVNVFHYNKLAKAFGHGVGFTIGLLLLNNIFLLILGFGKSQYLGKGEPVQEYREF